MTSWPLTVLFPLTLICSIAVVLAHDALTASYAARHPTFPYQRLWPVQLVLYVLIGFFAMDVLLDLRLAEVIGAATGFVDGTVGWAITWRIGPGRAKGVAPPRMALAVISTTVFGFGLALAGALAFNLVAAALIRAHG